MPAGSPCELTSRSRFRFLAMGHLLQAAIADEVAHLAPHRLALGVGFTDIAEALRPAHYRCDLHPDWQATGDQLPSLDHDPGHARDRSVELVERRQNPECVVHGCG